MLPMDWLNKARSSTNLLLDLRGNIQELTMIKHERVRKENQSALLWIQETVSAKKHWKRRGVLTTRML